MTPADYHDLLGLRYRPGSWDVASGALDCAGVARAFLLRLGLPPEAFPSSHGELDAAARRSDGGWRIVDDGDPCAASEVGDLVTTKDPATGEIGVLVVACRAPRTRLLTAQDGRGVFTIGPGYVRNCTGVWRWSSWPA